MIISRLRTINFFRLFKQLGQLSVLFVLGVLMLTLSSFLVFVSGQWDWLVFGILIGTLPFIYFYLAGFILAPKRFYQAKMWKNQPSSLRWGVAVVCALSGYLSVGELNGVAESLAFAQPMSLFEQLLVPLGALTLFMIVYMPLRAVSLFRCLGMAKTNSMGELFEDHNEDIFRALAVPSKPILIMVYTVICFSLFAWGYAIFEEGVKYTLLFLLEIIAVLEIAYVYLSSAKTEVSSLTNYSSASRA